MIVHGGTDVAGELGTVSGEVIRAQAAAPFFARILGERWHALPAPLRALHASKRQCWHGVATVERGRGPLARLCAALMRFPAAADAVPLRVEITPHKEGSMWRRRFGTRSFASVLSQGRGHFANLLLERLGPLSFGIALMLEGGKLRYDVRRWSAFGLPMPGGWAPGGVSQEFDDGGRFGFDVEIGHGLTGLIVRYKGWLVPEATP